MEAPKLTVKRAKRLRREMTLPEVLLWRQLRPSVCPEARFRRQHPIGPYILDFYSVSAALAVEIDGYSHDVGDRPAHDARRDAWLAKRGIRTLRLAAQDVLRDPDSALATILAALPPQSLRDSSPKGGASER